MIGAAPVFGTGAVLGRLRVAQVLLLLPLRSTVLKPDLHLRRMQTTVSLYSVTSKYCILFVF